MRANGKPQITGLSVCRENKVGTQRGHGIWSERSECNTHGLWMEGGDMEGGGDAENQGKKEIASKRGEEEETEQRLGE